MNAPFDITPFLGRDEGQHFDRKSLFDGLEGKKRPRDRRTVRDQVAEYVAGFANSEGGVLVLGIEDDHTVTGHSLPPAALATLLQVPQTRLRPPQPAGFTLRHEGHELIVFDVPAADGPVMVEGNGFPFRMGDQTVQSSEKQIEALKFRGLVESWESRPSSLALGDLDPELLARARQGAGLTASSNEEYLLKRKLADRRGRTLVLRRGAELLFAKDEPDHPNAGMRLFRVVGTERRYGAEHNVEERPRFEGKLPAVLTDVFDAIDGIIRRPSRLVGTHFRTVPEYPEFSWKEAILNAAAHRDYNVEGRTTEIWFFDDRLEVTNPGSLVPDVTLGDLLAQKRVHVSRNPRTVRALVDLGFMRDQGEGLPRMFSEMEGLFLPDPTIEVSDREFRLTLRNTPTLSADDKDFIAGLGDASDLSDTEVRVLLEASRKGRVDNARMREMTGADTLGASMVLRKLRDRGYLEMHAAGPASFYELGPASQGSGPRNAPGDSRGYQEELPGKAGGTPGDIRGSSRGKRGELLGKAGGAPEDIEVVRDGQRPRKDRLWPAIVALCTDRWMTSQELATALGNRSADQLIRAHLTPMVTVGLLVRRHEEKNHPQQAYRAARAVESNP